MTEKKYFLIDARKKPLGRIATQAAVLLRGKNLAAFAPNVNPNQIVIIINSDKLFLTGSKSESKRYWHHSGHPGGIKETKFVDLMKSDSTEIVKKAVKGMIPHNRLTAEILKNLKVFKADTHSFTKEKIQSADFENTPKKVINNQAKA